FTPEYEHKARVLQFVSQPHKTYFELEEKDNIENDFFYMPNQFWKHKNHMLAFEAIDRLKSEGVEICLVCTGCFDDYRNREYIQDIKDFIKKNSLEKQIKILGLIAPRDVFALIKFSKAVINPSLFEGWSSTVEECKSVGKNMILSNLDVHKEQCPEATFFERNSVNSLRDVLRSYDKANKENINTRSILMKRTEKFATAYIRIVEEIFPQKSN
ncbi:MAG: glycosyltransferase family 4 protein, partial [Wolinella succinogenes]|uniref:glycosyltransferase n=1 Tax=Wolinella succinogenes TaxID=844 RepID=UPI00169DFB3F